MNAKLGRFEKTSVFSLALLLLATDAHAYLDPGTGSFLLQLLIGGALGSLFVFKRFWRQIIAFFSRFRTKDPDA